ncbi:MAG: hypothetical protein ACE5KL_08265 [Alphaproteobacteria bacterium]
MTDQTDTTPTTAEDTVAKADAVIEAARSAMRETAAVEEAKAKDFASFTETIDRSRIAKLIVWAFVASIGALILFIFVGAIVFDGWSEAKTSDGAWLAAAREIGEALQDVMLPVVTLVLGFYFGSAGKK